MAELEKKQNIKIAVYLSNLPLAESYDVGPEGMAIAKRLVYNILPAEAEAIKLALSLKPDEIIAVTLGHKEPTQLLKAALALGATKAVHIGSSDWPLEPQPKILAEAFKEVAEGCDLILCADTGNSVNGVEVVAALSVALNCPSVTGVYKAEISAQGLQVSRKLEKGKRQDLLLQSPCLLALLPSSQEDVIPDLAAKLKAEATEIIKQDISYSLLSRKTKGVKLHTDYWQKSCLKPQTKQLWQPDSSLSGGQRLNAMVKGEIAARNGQTVSGSPQECAWAIINYLLEAGIIQTN